MLPCQCFRSGSHLTCNANIVKFRSRKELKHAQLISEVITLLSGRFKPEVSLVKTRIEDLISRDYLERPEDEDMPGVYRYVA